jgi:hypothetical protein
VQELSELAAKAKRYEGAAVRADEYKATCKQLQDELSAMRKQAFALVASRSLHRARCFALVASRSLLRARCFALVASRSLLRARLHRACVLVHVAYAG